MQIFALELKSIKNESAKHHQYSGQGDICLGCSCFVQAGFRCFSSTTKIFYAAGLITN
jgi:hypothetical protein